MSYIYDIVKVKIYEMTGDKPDPDNDILLGECDVKMWETNEFSVVQNFAPGAHRIYAIGLDRFGNKSMIKEVIEFTVQND
ncbi:MAG: hypothetical protein H0Z28_11215 [Archaeoglobus sp.]|nr:hypothetical protein [Archaeoglobus sp.]